MLFQKVYYSNNYHFEISLFLLGHMQLVLLIGAKLQHIIATLAIENAGLTGSFGSKLRPRDDLFWFKKPELLLSLIHFILFQVSFGVHDACTGVFTFIVTVGKS